MRKVKKVLLVFFNGKSNAGGAERMVLYLEEYLQSRGFETEIIDEHHLLNTFFGKQFKRIFNHRHFSKRKAIYMGRFTSAYLWSRKLSNHMVISNGESTPFFPVDFIINQGCYHVMERDYGRKEEKLSRIAKLQRLACTIARQVITVTEKVKNDLVVNYRIPAEKITIVSNRVDTNFFKVLPREITGKKTVLCAGRLEVGKGLVNLQKLADIIEKSTDWKLLIACNNSTNVELFSHLKNTEVKIGLGMHNINAEAYSKADLVFFPSLSESFGMVTIEALSAGVPVVGNPVGILPLLAARNFPGVHVFEGMKEDILNDFTDIVDGFRAGVDRHELHAQVEEEFGIPSYRKSWDNIISASFIIPKKP